MKSVNKYIQYLLHYYCIFIFHFIFLFCFTEPENAEKSMIFIYIIYCLSRIRIKYFFALPFDIFFRNIPCQKPVPPVYSIFIRFQPKRRKINPKEPPKTLSQEKSWNRVFLMEKREKKPKRNLKKGLTKPKTRHHRSVKKRKRDLKNEQKKRRGAERLSEKRIKKDSLLQPDYLDILWIKPSRF